MLLFSADGTQTDVASATARVEPAVASCRAPVCISSPLKMASAFAMEVAILNRKAWSAVIIWWQNRYDRKFDVYFTIKDRPESFRIQTFRRVKRFLV